MIKTNTMQIMEQALQRFQTGGFINGDYVTINKKITGSAYFKDAPGQTQEFIKNCMDTDLHLRVSALNPVLPSTGFNAGGNHAATGFVADIVIEYAPGLYKNPLTIPVEFLKLVASGPDGFGTIDVPDSVKGKNKVHGPEEIANQKLPTKNTKIGNSKGPTETEYAKKDMKAKTTIKESSLEDTYSEMLNEGG